MHHHAMINYTTEEERLKKFIEATEEIQQGQKATERGRRAAEGGGERRQGKIASTYIYI